MILLKVRRTDELKKPFTNETMSNPASGKEIFSPGNNGIITFEEGPRRPPSHVFAHKTATLWKHTIHP